MARPKSKCRLSYHRFKKKVPGAKDTGFYAPWFHQKRRLKGKKTGLSGNQFVVHLFEMNELLPPEKKLTDEQLAREIADEHPNSFIAKTADPNDNMTVNSLRQAYNRGKYDRWKVPPAKMSFRYNEDGIVVDPKKGKRMMTAQEIKRELRIHARKRAKAVLEESSQKNRIREEQDKILRAKQRAKEIKQKAILKEARRVQRLRAEGWKIKKRPNKEIIEELNLDATRDSRKLN